MSKMRLSHRRQVAITSLFTDPTKSESRPSHTHTAHVNTIVWNTMSQDTQQKPTTIVHACPACARPMRAENGMSWCGACAKARCEGCRRAVPEMDMRWCEGIKCNFHRCQSCVSLITSVMMVLGKCPECSKLAVAAGDQPMSASDHALFHLAQSQG
jgi:hypothetical protein